MSQRRPTRTSPKARLRSVATRTCGICVSSDLRWTKVRIEVPCTDRSRMPSVALAWVPHGECLSCGLEFRTWQAAEAQHAAASGFGIASIRRWETGATVPNASSDRLLRIVLGVRANG